MNVNKEEVRMLVQDVGYKEAAWRTGISYAALRKMAQRGKWNVRRQEGALVTKLSQSPADAQLAVLQHRRDKSKLHLSKYVEKASHRASSLEGEAILKASKNVKNVADIHGVIWPEKGDGDSGVLGGLQVFSAQTVIQVNERSSNSASDV